MTGGTFDRLFWAETLKRLDLETPGREEAVHKTLEDVKKKKEIIIALREQKMRKAMKGRKKK